MTKKTFFVLLFLFLAFNISIGYGQHNIPTWDKNYYEKNKTEINFNERPINLLDIPTANYLSHGYYEAKLRMYAEGGVLGSINISFSEKFMLGISYGGQNIIGHSKILWHESPGIDLRYNLMVEKVTNGSNNGLWNIGRNGRGVSLNPAISIGFNSQGFGVYYPELHRYQIKAKGLYAVSSVNMGNTLGIHGGLNYSNKNSSNEKNINFFCGLNLKLDKNISVFWEYDFGINDNAKESLGRNRGYMNAAVRWIFSQTLLMEIAVKNLTNNTQQTEGISDVPKESQEIGIIYFFPNPFLKKNK